jgi:hypothetical protein
MKYKTQMSVVTPTKIQVSLELLRPSPRPVPSVDSLSSTRAKAGCAAVKALAVDMAATNWGKPLLEEVATDFSTSDFLSAEHTILLCMCRTGRPTTGPATRAGRLLQLGKDFCTKQAVAEAQLQVEMSAAMAVEIFAERCTDAQRIGAIGRELGR